MDQVSTVAGNTKKTKTKLRIGLFPLEFKTLWENPVKGYFSKSLMNDTLAQRACFCFLHEKESCHVKWEGFYIVWRLCQPNIWGTDIPSQPISLRVAGGCHLTPTYVSRRKRWPTAGQPILFFPADGGELDKKLGLQEHLLEVSLPFSCSLHSDLSL